MNVFAKDGKKFLKAIDDYFKDFEKATGIPAERAVSLGQECPANAPDPVRIIDSLDMICHSGDHGLTLYFRGSKQFDGYCSFLDAEDKFSDSSARVFVCDHGAWQMTLLLVLSTHVMPKFWHAYYMHWRPVFDDKDLQNLRKSKRDYSCAVGETHDFLPKDLPTEPTVMPVEEGRKYKTTFYAWSDFGGYLKIISTITFPRGGAFAVIRDVEISTEIEAIVPYRLPIVF